MSARHGKAPTVTTCRHLGRHGSRLAAFSPEENTTLTREKPQGACPERAYGKEPGMTHLPVETLEWSIV
jgi:hypothetical protein